MRNPSQTTPAQDLERLEAIAQQLKVNDEQIRRALAILGKGQPR